MSLAQDALFVNQRIFGCPIRTLTCDFSAPEHKHCDPVCRVGMGVPVGASGYVQNLEAIDVGNKLRHFRV